MKPTKNKKPTQRITRSTRSTTAEKQSTEHSPDVSHQRKILDRNEVNLRLQPHIDNLARLREEIDHTIQPSPPLETQITPTTERLKSRLNPRPCPVPKCTHTLTGDRPNRIQHMKTHTQTEINSLATSPERFYQSQRFIICCHCLPNNPKFFNSPMTYESHVLKTHPEHTNCPILMQYRANPRPQSSPTNLSSPGRCLRSTPCPVPECQIQLSATRQHRIDHLKTHTAAELHLLASNPLDFYNKTKLQICPMCPTSDKPGIFSYISTLNDHKKHTRCQPLPTITWRNTSTPTNMTQLGQKRWNS